jgi:hypothetical protein
MCRFEMIETILARRASLIYTLAMVVGGTTSHALDSGKPHLNAIVLTETYSLLTTKQYCSILTTFYAFIGLCSRQAEIFQLLKTYVTYSETILNAQAIDQLSRSSSLSGC